MQQTAVAQGVCIASSRVVAAVVAAADTAATAAQGAAAAGHREQCGKGQATNSACHSVESLAGALAPSGKVRTHTCLLCD